MTRPFSLTMQAHRLDLHRLWLVLLAGSILMLLLWIGWAATDSVVVYESSNDVTPSSRGPSKTTVTAQGNIERVVSERERFLEARFPVASRGSLMAGQQANVFLRGRPDAEALDAVVTDVQKDERDPQQIRVTLRLTAPEDELGPALESESAPPERVRIAVRTSKPLELVLPGLASDGGPPAPDSARRRP